MKTGYRIGLNWSVFSRTGSGAARRAFELHRHLSGSFDFVAFVNSVFPVTMIKAFPGIEFVEIASSRSFGSRTRELFSGFWRKQLASHGCDLFVTDTLPIPSGTGNVKTCITIHDLRYLASRQFVDLKRYLLMRLFMKPSLKRADSVVVVSDWTGELLKKEFPFSSEKISVIPNAVSYDFAETFDGETPSSAEPYILSVGHLEKRKNFEVLIEAFRLIADRWNGLLVLVGRDQGSMESIIGKSTELGISERMVIRNDVDYETLKRLYRNCELLVCPSMYEGFGMTVLEGMASGRPVVASDIPPHREVGQSACIYADPENPSEFADVIMNIISSRELKASLVEKGFKRAEDFSWSRSAEQLGSLYRSLLEN